MWLGKWTKELSALYDLYWELFDIEPDCYDTVDYDNISYNQFVRLVKQCILTEKPLDIVIKDSH